MAKKKVHKKRDIHIKVNPELYDDFKDYCDSRHIGLSTLIRNMMVERLEKQGYRP